MTKAKDMTFALRLRSLYAAMPYDQKELARKVGVSISTLLQWEAGDALPDVNQLKSVALYFGLPCEFFLEDISSFLKDKEIMQDWQIADRLGLSEGTVELLRLLAEDAPGKVLDGVDDAIFSMVKSHLDAKEEWSGE